jgi:hypothetical protein
VSNGDEKWRLRSAPASFRAAQTVVLRAKRSVGETAHANGLRRLQRLNAYMGLANEPSVHLEAWEATLFRRLSNERDDL